MTTLNQLQDAIPALPERDVTFAKSLLTQWQDRGSLSEKQMHWVAILVERAKPQPPAPKTPSLEKLHALFDKAHSHLKRPALVFSNGGAAIRVYRSTNGRYPGAIYVVEPETRTWLARVHTDNTLEVNNGAKQFFASTIEKLPGFLERLAEDPEKVAAEYGKVTGCCCFCNTRLTDERSTSVGYGPVCAKKWGLSWGTRAAVAASLQAA